jgi:hypothetical protein
VDFSRNDETLKARELGVDKKRMSKYLR